MYFSCSNNNPMKIIYRHIFNILIIKVIYLLVRSLEKRIMTDISRLKYKWEVVLNKSY